MSVEHIDFLVEEPSMEVFLRGLLPRVLSELSFDIYPFQCKEELLAQLPGRLRGYASWLPKTYRIVVVIDQDDDDCAELKRRLEQFAQQAGLATRACPSPEGFAVVNRIAIEEREAWYFGDWEAICRAFPRVSTTVTRKAKFRNPDGITGGTKEAFERALQKAGYFRTGLRQLEIARSIAPHLNPVRNTSHSFQVFWRTLQELASS